MAIEGEGSGGRVVDDNVLELLRAAQASVQVVDRSLTLCRYGYWHRRAVPTPPQVPSSLGIMERSPKRRRPEEGESSERVVEAIKLVRTAKVSLQLVERYLDSVPVCRHTLVTRRLPTSLRDNGEFLTECARCGKLF